MPVFTVSEKTCPQVGFSWKRWIRPSSSTMMMPNSSGPGTLGTPTATIAQRVLRVLDTARGAQRRLLGRVLQAHIEVLAIAEIVAHHGGEELDGDDGLVESVLAEQPEDVFHDRLVGHRQQRLRL